MFRSTLLALTAGLLALCGGSTHAAPMALTPIPAQMTAGEGAFHLTRNSHIYVPPHDADLLATATWFRDKLLQTRGLRLIISTNAPAAGEKAIHLQRIQTFAAEDQESYHLTVAPDDITIGATTPQGAFYGAVTLWQLATQDASSGAADLPAVTIFDQPRFKWRGLMIDSVRHFQSPAEIERLIDAMATQKLNILQWHLTDDQGWRLQIKAYPKLTQTACRREAGAAGHDARGKPVLYCGVYTQAQVRAVVAYAQARHITIVPEIDVPGHATAALTAYPEFGAEGTPPKQGLSDWGVYPNLYNVDDKTFAFIDTVLDEVMALFPSPYIHVGGDEAIKPQWQASSAIQARMKTLGIKDEDGLQSWFMARVGDHLTAKGRKLVGWDEILQGGIADDATVMSWRGIDGAVAAAKLGHDTVLSPSPTLYLNHRQSKSSDEPPGRGQIITLKDVYNFDPAPAAIAPEDRGHIIGLQANVWTEHARTEARVEAQAFPRLLAVAELGWSPAASHDWDSFAARLPADLGRLSRLGIRYDTVPFEPQLTLTEAATGITAGLTTTNGIGEIRYSVNGKTPASLTLPAGTVLTAQTFAGGRSLGARKTFTLTQSALDTRSSYQLDICDNKLDLALEDDAATNSKRAIILMDILHPCWIWRGADTSHGLTVTARVANYPFNFQLGNHPDPVIVDTPITAAGEFNIHLDTCDGPLVAALPLAPATKNDGVSILTGRIAATPGAHDLCLTFAQKAPPPQWALQDIRLH